MALRPVKVRIKESFEHDMSGLEIRAEGEQLDRYFIKSVDNYSPAALAGIKPNDELVFLNNKNVSNLKINDIIRTLSQKEGKSVEVFVRRDGTLQFFYFTLKRFI
jgi:C-terminal processing protease CtpA/Prc